MDASSLFLTPGKKSNQKSKAERVGPERKAKNGQAKKVVALPKAKERQAVRELIERIVAECPVRRPTSADERRAQLIVRDEFEKLGLKTHEESFTFNENLYANLALHFGVGTLGSVVSGVAPLAGLLLHLTAGVSYWADSTRRAYLLRRLLPFQASQNLVATIPAAGEPDLRLVILAHADAAFTGLIFDPRMIKLISGAPPFGISYLSRSLAMTTHSQFVLAGFDFLRLCFGPLTWPLRPLEALLSVPALLAFVLNLQMVLRDEIVPGANDDLSGVAALVALAQRLGPAKPANVELDFVVTGCEETSLGGADALVRSKQGVWDRTKTVFLGLDGLTNGELKFLEPEGEVVAVSVPRWLRALVEETAVSESRFAEVEPFQPPVGGSDIAAVLARGWDGVCLACVDMERGSPRHYHAPTDTPENLEYDQLMFSIDFAERLARKIIEFKLR